jgi:PAS domain S-box-containing protein
MNGSIHRERTASEPQDRSSRMAHSIEVPAEIIQKWQEFVNLLAEIMQVPSASIMRADPAHIKVFVSSTSKGNPCEPGALDTGPYCETVMKTGQPLLVPDARENEAWKANPHVRLGMISYLGVPIGWPDGRLFGTICVRDNKRNEYSEAYLKLLLHFRDMLQADLKSLVRLHGEIEERDAKIRRSEAYLAEAQRLSKTGSWAINPAMTKILYWSEEAYRIWGFDPLQGLPNRETVWRRIHPGDRDRMYEETQEALLQKRDYKVDFRIVLPDGTVKYLEAVGHHQFSADGELVQVVGTNVDVTERRRAEQALREREAKIRRLVDANIIGIFFWDFDGRILEANEAFLHIVGYDHEDLVAGRIRWSDLTPPEWRDHDMRLIQEHKATGILPPFEKEYFRKDGSRVPVLIGVATFEEGGDQGVAFVLDLTERKSAEEALRESERSARSAIDGIAGLIVVLAPNGEVEAVNRQVFEYFGRSLEWLKNWGTNDTMHPEDLPRIAEIFQRSIATGTPFHYELRLRKFDGEYRWFDTRHVPIRDDSGRIARWYVLATDIEDRKRAEHASRSALDGIAGLVAVLTPNGELETVNRPLFEYFGRSLEWLKNWGTNDAVHPEDLPRILELFQRGMASGLPFNFELRMRRFDGEYRWFDNRGVPIRDDSGRIARWCVLLTDIEDRTRALAQLEQMQSDFAHMNRVSVMGELAAELSHEITQPISSARNNARAAQNFLDMQPPNLGEVREALSCVVGDTDRAGDIIDRVRDHIKKAPPRKEQFDLNEAINEVIVLGRSEIIKNGVSVQTRLSERLFPLHGDRVQLQQVVLNLLLNAVEAMGSVEAAPRELLISTKQDHTGVVVAVHDSGPGIHPEHLEHVFKSFYTTKPRGTGMGLSICRSIIEAHGGRLWAEANEPRGAIFQFTLPAAA